MELININIANVDFNCPYCLKKYSDCDDNYIDRCNKNKSKCTSVKCSCGNKFYMTYNIKGDAVSFKRESTSNAY